MNLENIKEGMEIKNYKVLCELLGEKVKSSNSKKAQLNDWLRFFEYEKNGTKFIITKIFSEHEIKEKEITKGRKPIKFHENFPDKLKNLVDTYELDLSEIASYSKEVLRWKCEECNEEFDRNVYTIVTSPSCKCNRCNMSIGARKIYDILKMFDVNFTIEHTFNDLKSAFSNKNLRFDFALFKENELKLLIEYDGGFHDVSEKVKTNDDLKNQYCIINNIPLLRVHHNECNLTEVVAESLALYDVLKDNNDTKRNQIILNEIDKHEKEIKKLLEEIEIKKSKVDELKKLLKQ